MALALETGSFGQRRQRHIGLHEHLLRPIQSGFHDILVGRYARRLLENATKVGGRYSCHRCHLFKAVFLCRIGKDRIHYPVQAIG